MILESFCHASSSFVTLTYDPKIYAGDSLVPKDCTDWLKRLRKAVAPQKLRYFLVGEYGDHTQRPHYHLALFGLGPESEDLVRKTWGMGHVMLGDLTPHSARYITGYVVKKLTAKDNPKLKGRHPEFARMSKGIGSLAIPAIAASLDNATGRTALANTVDVPTFLRSNGRTLPLGRYLRSKLRKTLDLYTVCPITGEVKYGSSQEALSETSKELSSLHTHWQASPDYKKKSFKDFLTSLDDGAVALMETRLENSNTRKKL